MNTDLIMLIIQISLVFILILLSYRIGKNEGGRIGMEMGIALGRKAEAEGWDEVTIEEFKFTVGYGKKKNRR